MVSLFDEMLKSKQTILICDKSHAIIIVAPFTDWLFCAQKVLSSNKTCQRKGEMSRAVAICMRSEKSWETLPKSRIAIQSQIVLHKKKED